MTKTLIRSVYLDGVHLAPGTELTDEQAERVTNPHATEDDIRDLGPEQAAVFYRREFWERYRVALIEDQAVATKTLDLIVNVGPMPGIKILQRAVGAPADGALGPHTARLVNAQPSAKVLEGIRTAGAQYYRELVDRRPEYARFLDGWLTRLKS